MRPVGEVKAEVVKLSLLDAISRVSYCCQIWSKLMYSKCREVYRRCCVKL